MGLFDRFRRRGAPEDDLPEAPPPTHGWDAIDAAFEGLYPGQTEPLHWAPLVHRIDDISENAAAFDGVSAYDAGGFWHYVSYGLTELYAKENRDRKVSGFGYELTLRVPKTSETPPVLGRNLLEAIGKSVWKGAEYGPGHTIQTGPVDGRPETQETALLVLADPAFPEVLDTPNGQMRFLLLLGIEDAVRQRVLAAHEAQGGAEGWEAEIVAELKAANPDLVTPLGPDGD